MPRLIKTTIEVTVLSERDIQELPLTVIAQEMIDGEFSGTYDFKEIEILKTKTSIKKACAEIYTAPSFFLGDD